MGKPLGFELDDQLVSFVAGTRYHVLEEKCMGVVCQSRAFSLRRPSSFSVEPREVRVQWLDEARWQDDWSLEEEIFVGEQGGQAGVIIGVAFQGGWDVRQVLFQAEEWRGVGF